MTTREHNSEACPYCSSDGFYKVFHEGACPKVKSIEYHPDGTIKKVEFHEPLIVSGYL